MTIIAAEPHDACRCVRPTTREGRFRIVPFLAFFPVYSDLHGTLHTISWI